MLTRMMMDHVINLCQDAIDLDVAIPTFLIVADPDKNATPNLGTTRTDRAVEYKDDIKSNM
jgi:hypothetical protein